MPEGVEQGILKGIYRCRPGPAKPRYLKAHLLGSGPLLRSALRAQEILAEKYHVSADVWSVTSYKALRNDALQCRRWNMLHPAQPPRQSYIEATLANETGVFVAVSDYMKIVPEQIGPWVPGGLFALGTDGFGRSDSRENLRRFFEVDAESVVIAVLHSLSRRRKMGKTAVARAIRELGVNPEKPFPALVV